MAFKPISDSIDTLSEKIHSLYSIHATTGQTKQTLFSLQRTAMKRDEQVDRM